MANTSPKKPALHGAAAASHSKAETEKAKTASDVKGSPSAKTGGKNDSGKKSR